MTCIATEFSESTRVDFYREMREDVMNENDEIVLLGVASSEIEANMWDQDLKAAGVRTLIRPGGPGAGAWASAATFEHQIFVRADQLELARNVLEGAMNVGDPLPRSRRAAPVVHPASKGKHRE